MNELGSMTMRDETGFTVVELFVTIMIIGVLAAFSAPQLKGRLSAYQVTGAARMIWVDLQRAKMLAMKEIAPSRSLLPPRLPPRLRGSLPAQSSSIATSRATTLA
jgi:Tfp pilus assembly protein FimT